MINLDPALLDQDKIRLAKRKKLWIILATPFGIVLLVALFFLRTGFANISMSVADGSGRYDSARGMMQMQKIGNFLEPYIAYYNTGFIDLLKAEDVDALKRAEEEFKESLKNNPPEEMLCPIYVNLAYSIELQADAKGHEEALVMYEQAISVLLKDGCASKKDDGSEKDKMAQDAKKRNEEKKEKALNSLNGLEEESEKNDEPSKEEEKIDEEIMEQIKQMQETVNRMVQNDVRSSYAAGGQYSIDYNEPNW